MIKNNNKWSTLSMQQKADLIKLYVNNGITSLDTIRNSYNSFATGGPIQSQVDATWNLQYQDLPNRYKQEVLKLAKELNYNLNDINEIYNSGLLKAPIEAKWTYAPSARKRRNDSPTSQESEALEKEMNNYLYYNADHVSPNMKYAIPYKKELEVKIPGVGRTTTNALDSLAKYAYEAKIPLSEALGLSAQETAFGALPFYNYRDIEGTVAEREQLNDFNRSLGNSSYFRNYGIIPAENIVRNFRYNIIEDPISRDIPPLLHAFKYWKKGDYNRGDSKHTSMVRNKGKQVMKTKVIQDWIKQSKFAQKALSLFE